jgi:hypothetical protein
MAVEIVVGNRVKKRTDVTRMVCYSRRLQWVLAN